MVFTLDTFLEQLGKNPSQELFDPLRKSDLLAIGKHFNLDVRTAMRKAQINKIVLEHLVDEGYLGKEFLENLPDLPVDVSAIEMRHLDHRIQFTGRHQRAQLLIAAMGATLQPVN